MFQRILLAICGGNDLHGRAERRALSVQRLGSQGLLIIAADVVDGGDAVGIILYEHTSPVELSGADVLSHTATLKCKE